MRLASLDRLRCPACLAAGRAAGMEADPTRVGGGEDGGEAGDLLEGYLVCRACRAAGVVVGGVAVLPRDVRAHFASHGNVYRRTRIGDPRLVRFVLGLARGGADFVPFAEVVARYGDLLPPVEGRVPPAPDPSDAALDDALREARPRGPALDLGCGVGRSAFVLAARAGDATGCDRSVARVRRARNVQTAEEFRLPGREGDRLETPVDLVRLVRAPVDFVVADPSALPFASGAFGCVVLHAGDGEGPWPDADAARREALRVLAPGGLLLVETAAPGAAPRFAAESVP